MLCGHDAPGHRPRGRKSSIGFGAPRRTPGNAPRLTKALSAKHFHKGWRRKLRAHRPQAETRNTRHLLRGWPGGMHTLLYCLLVAGLLTSCARRHVPPPTPAPSPPPSPPDTTPVPDFHVEYGTATWYGRERQGRRTASGESFDRTKLTAAHRTARLGTYARVTN